MKCIGDENSIFNSSIVESVNGHVLWFIGLAMLLMVVREVGHILNVTEEKRGKGILDYL